MKVSKEELKSVVEKLKQIGAKFEPPPPYVEYKVRLGDSVALFYSSGTIVFGGKEPNRLRELVAYLLSTRIDRTPRIGCDEAGKGEVFGPLVVACVVAKEEDFKELLYLRVRDSKKLSRKQILNLAEEIKKTCRGLVRVIKPEVYNKLYQRFKNSSKILAWAYEGLITKLLENHDVGLVVIDKFSHSAEKFFEGKFGDVKVKVVPKADEEDIVVASASIVAKAERIKYLQKLSRIAKFEIPEGNKDAGKLILKIPKEKRKFFIKEHFSIKLPENDE